MPSLRTRESLTSHSVCGCCAKVCLFGLGGVIAAVGIVLALCWPYMVDRIVPSQLALSPGSRSYNMWVETPIPMYFNIYMWNWTNPKTSLRGPDKPAFTQMGPYVFLEHHSKKNVTWNDNSTVTYLNQKVWHFVPEKSNGTLDDRVTNLNAIAMTIGWVAWDLPASARKLVNTFINFEESLVKTDTVGNLLFYGSSDKILNIIHNIPYIKDMSIVKNMPKKFGWFYGRNLSLTGDGVFTMYTGQDEINRLGLMSAWNYKNQTSFRGECGRVHGTYGEEFPPDSVRQDLITLYANDLCSVLNLKRAQASSMFGIPSVLFVGGEDVFSNTTTCYCANDTSCPASGVRELARCNHSPALVSWPHFYLADPTYRQAVDGMQPDPAQHQFYMNLAEVTSVPLEVRGRMQLNFLMQTIPDMEFFKNIKKTVMPMLWFDQQATLTPAVASEMVVLVTLVNWGRICLLVMGVVGLLFITIGVVLSRRGVFDTDQQILL